ncbi:DMT family transporter [Candidatus Bipolaricaulota bacterium]|nr:DMT family transporter [Candidatus Bipolaricaulota bacterium]
MKIKTAVILSSGVIAISFAAILIRLSTAPPLIISFYRMLFSVVLLTPVVVHSEDIRRQIRRLSGRDVFLLLIAGIFLSIHFALWVTSLNHTSVASSVVLVTTQPLFIVVIENFFLRKKPSRKLVGGLIVAGVGSLLIGYGGFSTSHVKFLGDVFALLGAGMAAGYFLIGGEVRKRIKLIPYVYVVYGVSAIFLLLYSVVGRLPLVRYSPYNYLMFFLLAAGPTMVGHTSFNWVLKEVNASLVGVTLLAEPVGSSILAALMFGEYPSYWTIVGGSLVLISIYFLWRSELFEGLG